MEILKEELTVLRPFILEFGPCGFHILHDVFTYLSQQGWKEVDEKYTRIKKFCNFMKIRKDGLAASVILYVQWPIETQIECYIESVDNRSIKISKKEIVKAVGYVLAQKNCSLQLKFYCYHPKCVSLTGDTDGHFAYPDSHYEGFLVCEKTNCTYPCPEEQRCLLEKKCLLDKVGKKMNCSCDSCLTII